MKASKFHFLVLLFVLCASAIIAADKLHSEISAANAEWMKQYNAGNAAGVAELYTDDAKLMPPNREFVMSKKGITAVWQGLMDAGGKSATLNVLEVMGSGDAVTEVGTYEVMDKDGKAIDKGKYMVHWKKVGSAWKIHRDIWNSSMPAAPAK
jgi:ketosteroid isomerase-like protein